MASKWSGMADGNTKKVENIFTTWPDKSSILDIIKSISLSLVPACPRALCWRYMDGHIKKNFIMWNGHLTDTWGFIYYGRAEDGQTINIRVSSVLLVCTAQREELHSAWLSAKMKEKKRRVQRERQNWPADRRRKCLRCKISSGENIYSRTDPTHLDDDILNRIWIEKSENQDTQVCF